jgi:hypothetical protein
MAGSFRPKSIDVLDLFLCHLRVGCGLPLPQDFARDGEAASLLSREVPSDGRTLGAPEVIDAVRYVLSNVDLAVRAGDLVDDVPIRFIVDGDDINSRSDKLGP